MNFKFYLVNKERLFCCDENNYTYEFINYKWISTDKTKVYDKLIGYNSKEPKESPYKMFDSSIMSTIEEITKEEAEKRFGTIMSEKIETKDVNFIIEEHVIRPDDNNQLLIKLSKNLLSYNNKQIDDVYLIADLKELMFSYKDKIMYLKKLNNPIYKGGVSKVLRVSFANDNIALYCNTSNSETSDFYNNLKSIIIKKISKN